MKNYTITVNGVSYEVSVEENHGAVTNKSDPVIPTPSKEVVVPQAAVEANKDEKIIPSTTNKPVTQSSGNKKIEAPMPGKILSVKISNGDSFKRGDVLFILEAMKLENEIVAPEDGIVASIQVSSGDVIDSGVILATFN